MTEKERRPEAPRLIMRGMSERSVRYERGIAPASSSSGLSLSWIERVTRPGESALGPSSKLPTYRPRIQHEGMCE